jgi:hypothetical protein
VREREKASERGREREGDRGREREREGERGKRTDEAEGRRGSLDGGAVLARMKPPQLLLGWKMEKALPRS